MHLAFHKPYGVLCQFTPDRPGQHTLADFGFPPGVYPVGRLDMDSEGLLILSDEAGFNSLLLDPVRAHPRTYHVQVEGVPNASAVARLQRGGIRLKGYLTRPCGVVILSKAPDVPPRDPPIRVRQSIPDHWLEMTLSEGKNRQVRRMTASVGLPTLRLIRVAIGGFCLAGLEPGYWREMDGTEVLALTHAAFDKLNLK